MSPDFSVVHENLFFNFFVFIPMICAQQFATTINLTIIVMTTMVILILLVIIIIILFHCNHNYYYMAKVYFCER